MCGLCGFLALNNTRDSDALLALAGRMADSLRHRGPDDDGVWADPAAGLALGHRRLAIIDLSPEGHQPMLSASGRYVLVFNGEIYNYRALRQELDQAGHSRKPWRGHSDTEVMLAAFEHWGIEAALSRFNGMFAFALWDRGERTLYLARDRLGEKPLYYGRQGNALLFGSELKALRAYPDWRGEVDRDALASYLRYNYVPAPYSIYRGIRKLPAAHYLVVQLRQGDLLLSDPIAYWSAKQVAEAGVKQPLAGSEQAIIEQMDTLLRASVASRMEADVPLGAFLSGGIDSSTVVALMQAQSSQPVRTFSIGFHEDQYNEADYAHAVAKHLATDHTELYVTPEEAMAVIPRLPTLYDEPFADPSQIPTFLVSTLARRYVTVSLTGDGGDELFGGYNRYFWGRRVWQQIGWMPQRIRRLIAAGLTAVSPGAWDTTLAKMSWALPVKTRGVLNGHRLHTLAEVLAVESADAMYRRLVSHWKHPAEIVPGASEPPTTLSNPKQWAGLSNFTQRMMYLDTVTYLPDDILVKVDRASMGVSLETRVPLLDHRAVEFAWRIPLAMKIRNGQGKWLLRQVLHRYVPARLLERPKQGFGVPIDSWLRGPLRDWAEDLIDEGRLRSEGFFDPLPIRTKWKEHLSGQRNWQYSLWEILMFQAWLNGERAAVSRVDDHCLRSAISL